MKIGFTGTRNGMTRQQIEAFGTLLSAIPFDEFHHGDCIGADNEAANLVFGLRGACCKTVVHPPVDEKLRAFNKLYVEMREPKTHFARNRDIVNECDVLIVCPLQSERQERGGTWYTHDYAIKRGKKVIVIRPDGTI